MRITQERRDSARARLAVLAPKGARMYALLDHVSRSGMRRRYRVYVVHDGRIYNVSGIVSDAAGLRWDSRNGGIVISGCGFDGGHDIVYDAGIAMCEAAGVDPHAGNAALGYYIHERM